MQVKPTTAKVMYALGAVAQATSTGSTSRGQATVHTYDLTGGRSVDVVVSNRGGRILRAHQYAPAWGFITYTGTVPHVAGVLLQIAADERDHLRA